MNPVDNAAEFASFPKMARLSREIIITEKIDGTNAQIYIRELGPHEVDGMMRDDPSILAISLLSDGRGRVLRAGSRTRWITPGDDNAGFAAWALANAAELMKLGPGRHFGEWWGRGIQRGYGLQERRFSLFNVSRWADADARPACCHVVPALYRGDFDTGVINQQLDRLKGLGSFAAHGFMNPEGIVIFHTASNIGFKKTIYKDELPKSLAA